tara:strand:- start:4923 stop:5225 length:303 start_codon:yes stop_codon:yes gene_type:complete
MSNDKCKKFLKENPGGLDNAELEWEDSRQDSNKKLVEILAELVEKHPEQRFSQILRNYGFISEKKTEGPYTWNNEFNLEPDKLLDRVLNTKKHIEDQQKD